MTGIIPKFTNGPVTYEVVEQVLGGQLVEARAAGKIGVAGAASLKVLGVATTDATNVAAGGSTTDAFGNPVISMVPIDQYCAVGGNGAIYPVTYTANASFGDRLIAGANGAVTPIPAVTTPTAADVVNTRAIIGECREPNGVVIATNAKGLAKIY